MAINTPSIDWIELGAMLVPVVAARPDFRLLNYYAFSVESV